MSDKAKICVKSTVAESTSYHTVWKGGSMLFRLIDDDITEVRVIEGNSCNLLRLHKEFIENPTAFYLEYGGDVGDVFRKAGESLYTCGAPCSAELLIGLFLDFRVREQKFIADLMKGEDKSD